MCENEISVGGFPQKYKTHIIGRDFLFLQGSNRKTALSSTSGSIQ
jgi:hypothetical protein